MTNSTQGPARKYFISAASAAIMMFGGSLCAAGMSMADPIDNPTPITNTEAPRFTPKARAEFTPIQPAEFTPIPPAKAPRFTPIAPAHEAPPGKADAARGGKDAAGHGDSRSGHSRGAR